LSETPTSQTTSAALADELKSFLEGFKDRDGQYKYFERVNSMMAEGATSLRIDYLDLDTFYPELATKLTNKPDEMLEAFREAALSLLREIHPSYEQEIHDRLQVRIANYTVSKSLRSIDTDLIDKLISISGVQVRRSQKKPLPKKVAYRCENCNAVTEATMKGLTLKKPSKCIACGEKDLKIDPEQSVFVDWQRIRLQELPEDLPAGHLPEFLDASVLGDLADTSRPGDRLVITGIVRLVEVVRRGEGKTGTFDLDFEVNNIEAMQAKERHILTKDDEARLREFVKQAEAYKKIITSFAPHIHGHEPVKEASVLMLVGGQQVDLKAGAKRRGDISVCLIGDPGLAKSEMLKFAARVAPRGIYTSGKGNSAAGLTAAVVKDKAGVLMLEAGAVVLGDMGIVCVDEADKMKEEDRSALHEVMEQQTCSITKAGFIATLNARVSIFMALNPNYGKYDPYKNLHENINLPIPLLTRFDIILIIRDTVDKDMDAKILDTIDSNEEGFIETDQLAKHIALARKMKPQWTQEALDALHKYYFDMRRAGIDSSSITITPRQYEGLKRLATAHAKLMLLDKIELESAKVAIAVVDNMFKTVGVDVNTGKQDLGVLYGKPQSEVSKQKLFMEIFSALADGTNNEVEEAVLIAELVKTGRFDDTEARSQITKFNREGRIYQRREKVWSKA
jgi:replicative DNA helicase Mcm